MIKLQSDYCGTNELFHSNEAKDYLCEYTHEGERWSIQIQATSFEDAEKRLKSLKSGKILGEIKAKIPLYPRWMERYFGRLMS